jgi:subtilase family serine protease
VVVVGAVLAPSAVAVAQTPSGAASSAFGERGVCGRPGRVDEARCFAHVRTHATTGKPAVTTGPAGYSPVQLQTAYGLTGAAASAGGGQTVAIVDAYDNPNVEADLAAYRSAFGLPPCTSANGCFRKVDQHGGTTYPAGNTSWGQEIDLDVDMVSAVCPKCHILLVEAASNSLANLGNAVNEASVLGTDAISNSYGATEFLGETSYEAYYNHPGVAVTVSAGDSGYGPEFPAASRYVSAVGGTTLKLTSTGTRASETVWSGTGSGCSAYVPKPAFQHDAGCARRTIGDVAADADPNTGVAVYDTYGSTGGANWYVFGGTSVASPIIAATYALAGNTAALSGAASLYVAPSGSLFDVTTGSNGRCTTRKNSSMAYLCTGAVGYDGPTGNGTPNGTTAV